MNTYVPAGASCSEPSIVNVARPPATKYSSSCASAGSSVCGSTTSSPALAAVYALHPNARIPSVARTGRHVRLPGPGIDSSSSRWTVRGGCVMDDRQGSLSSMDVEPLRDGHGRLIGDLRVSVTDRCNFRCQYCMPADGLPWLQRSALLTFEEIERLVRVFASMGVDELRLTGGEPLVRREFPRLVSMLAAVPGLRDLSLTTNGYLLERDA